MIIVCPYCQTNIVNNSEDVDKKSFWMQCPNPECAIIFPNPVYEGGEDATS